MDEFELIRTYFDRPIIKQSVVMGIGDDCAIVNSHSDKHWLLSIDTMVEGVHFPAQLSAEHIGSRALCAALSDLAAMGAEPEFFTLAITLPNVNNEWLQGFSKGLFSIAEAFSCPLVGGDTTRGPLCISVQVHGSVAAGKALTRKGARVGDDIYVTGVLGDGAAALACITEEMPELKSSQAYLLERFVKPEPQIELGKNLVGIASAALDISDGLVADLNHLCKASDVSGVINIEQLPISPIWKQAVSAQQAIAWALSGGDDYQLLFTAGEDKQASLAQMNMPITKIGKVIEKQNETSQVSVLLGGQTYTIDSNGYKHFD